jgi:hypothetical protein
MSGALVFFFPHTFILPFFLSLKNRKTAILIFLAEWYIISLDSRKGGDLFEKRPASSSVFIRPDENELL